jgi:hypothetical protein
MECTSFDYPTAPIGLYCTCDINELDDDVEDDNQSYQIIGFADFFFFNLLLLFVLPANSSIATRVCIAVGCIIMVQLGDLCTTFMLPYVSDGLPAVPFPTVFVTAYAIVVDAIIEYSNIDCKNLMK